MLALFDLDGTLIQDDSSRLWIDFCVKQGILEPSYLQQTALFQQQYHTKTLDMSAYITFFLRSVKGKSVEEVESLSDTFIKHCIKPYPQTHHLITKHKQDRCIVISATADFLVRKIAKHLGIEESIAVTCTLDNGIFSGKSEGIFSFQTGKVLRLKEYLKGDYKALMQDSCFYTDSINDLALLKEVSNPIVCNGDVNLLKIAKEKGYPCISLA